MYTTQTNIEDKLGASLSTHQTSYFNNVLDDMIDTFINNETETLFGSQTATTIYASGEDTSMLVLPTCHLITAVVKLNDDGSEADTLASGTDYLAYPAQGVDKYALKKITGTWDEGVENYKISANYGYNDIPADIVHVATEIAVNILTMDTNNYKSEKVGDWAVTYNDMAKQLTPEAQNILANYRRLSRDI